MRFLRSADFDRMGDFDDEGAVGGGGSLGDAAGRRQRHGTACRVLVVGEPSHTCADEKDRDSGGDEASAPQDAGAARGLEAGDAQASRHRLNELVVQRRPQCGALAALGRDLLALLGMARQERLDLRAPLRRQAVIDIGLQLVFPDGNVVATHFTLRSRVTRPPSTIERSFLRALDSLDITVPIGRSRMRAAWS